MLNNTRDNKETMLILYFNARSLIPQLDKLCALNGIHTPNVTSVVESWLTLKFPPLVTMFFWRCKSINGWN